MPVYPEKGGTLADDDGLRRYAQLIHLSFAILKSGEPFDRPFAAR
jgi:hypothetical protein